MPLMFPSLVYLTIAGTLLAAIALAFSLTGCPRKEQDVADVLQLQVAPAPVSGAMAASKDSEP